MAAQERGYQSAIALPLISEERTFGVLKIYSVETDAFDGDEVAILTELAGDLAFGITALRTRTERDRVARCARDEVTQAGDPSRAALGMRSLRPEIPRARRSG